MKKTQTYTDEFKMMVLNKLQSGEISSLSEANRIYKIGGKCTIQKWGKKLNMELPTKKRSSEPIRSSCQNYDSLLKALGMSYLRILELEGRTNGK